MYTVAIVGRPNVGKSTLFNRISRTRKALVGNEPGITRDRLLEIVQLGDKRFELIDTGGIVPDDSETIPEKVLEQAEVAIEGSSLILLMVDARAGLTPLDREVAALLNSTGKEFMVVANKVDVEKVEPEIYQFYELGVDGVFAVSAEHGHGVRELIDEILARVPESEATQEEDEIRVAIIGRPNVGKSSLINRILGRDRVIVTNVPGTTRDSVDTVFRYNDSVYRLVDTAGIRRKGKTELMAEKLSVVMARKNIEQADVVLLVIDASEGATKLDATIGGYAHDAGRSTIALVNKWDLVDKDTHTLVQTEERSRERMRFLDYAPMMFVSAKSGQRVSKILELVSRVYGGGRVKISTGELNRFITKTLRPTLRTQGGTVKSPIKYICQVGVLPPTFVLFLRGGNKLHFSAVRYVSNQLRNEYEFYGSPIRIIQRRSKWTGGKKKSRGS